MGKGKDLTQHVIKVANRLLKLTPVASNNGALSYALKHNQTNVVTLVSMGKDQAMRLPWVGPKVWNEANHLLRLVSGIHP